MLIWHATFACCSVVHYCVFLLHQDTNQLLWDAKHCKKGYRVQNRVSCLSRYSHDTQYLPAVLYCTLAVPHFPRLAECCKVWNSVAKVAHSPDMIWVAGSKVAYHVRLHAAMTHNTADCSVLHLGSSWFHKAYQLLEGVKDCSKSISLHSLHST